MGFPHLFKTGVVCFWQPSATPSHPWRARVVVVTSDFETSLRVLLLSVLADANHYFLFPGHVPRIARRICFSTAISSMSCFSLAC